MSEWTSSEPQAPQSVDQQWAQACLPLDPADGGSACALPVEDTPLHRVREALHHADEAPDGHTRHEALARISAQLAEEATARGRRPVPKPSIGRSD
jgi:hypothetical protein